MGPATSAAAPGTPTADGEGVHAVRPVIVFRTGSRWLALAATQVREVVGVLPSHRVPHRRDPRFVGLVNVRGELVPCIDIAALLGIERATAESPKAHPGHRWPRTVLIEQDGQTLAFQVDEVDAVHPVAGEALQPVPPGEPDAAGRLTQAQVDLPVGRTALIDPDLFWYAVNEVWR